MNGWRSLIVLLALAWCAPIVAQQSVGAEQRIATRAGVSVPVYAYWKREAVATVLLFSGGAGGYGKLADDGWPAGGNFLIRTGKHWATYPFNVVMVGRPSDGIDLALGAARTGDAHAADNVALLRAIKHQSPLPIWVIGTSMGTISAAATAIRDEEKLVAGVVLTSSIVAYRVPGSLLQQDLDRIRVPTLVLHHQDDACWACRPDEAKSIAGRLTQAPVSKTIFVSGGQGASGNLCGPLHHHGFVGMQNEAVDLIAAWIIEPTQ